MKRLKLIAVSLVVSLIAGAVYADDLIVEGPVTVTGTIEGNVIVKSGGTATLSGALIQGGVIVEPGGRLTSSGSPSAPRITIEGDVEADGATTISLSNCDIFGGVYDMNGGGLTLRRSPVGGEVNVETSSGSVTLDRSPVAGGGLSVVATRTVSVGRSNVAGDVKIATLGSVGLSSCDVDGDFKVTSAFGVSLSRVTGSPNTYVAGHVLVTNAAGGVSLSRGTEVAGDVKITNSGTDGSGFFGLITISESIVGGDLKLEDNFPSQISVWSNLVLGDVTIVNNMTFRDDIYVAHNDIGGDLTCGGNDSTPILVGNVVAGETNCDD